MAQRFNCSGLLIYSDPADYAPPGVPVYPNGPSLPLYGVQRGSLINQDGDPMTPGVPAIGKLNTNMLGQIDLRNFRFSPTHYTCIKITLE